MFKNRFLIVIGVVSLLLVTMAISGPSTIPNSVGANDFYQRHPNWGRNLDASDYSERHPEWASIADLAGDFALRHSEWTINVQSAAIPVTGMLEASDYFQRHPELSLSVEGAADLTDYFLRH